MEATLAEVEDRDSEESEAEEEPMAEPLGDEEEQPEPEIEEHVPLKPATRGQRACLCSGEVLIMLGHYGWLSSLCEIDHPDADKIGGRIYFHRRDIVGPVAIVEGDVVEFYLYADGRGLGAEEVRLQGSDAAVGKLGSPRGGSHGRHQVLRQGAAEFTPVVSQVAQRFGQGLPPALAESVARLGARPVMSVRMNAAAVEFVPGTLQCVAPTVTVPACRIGGGCFAQTKVTPAAAACLDVFAVNAACLSDSDSEDELGDVDQSERQPKACGSLAPNSKCRSMSAASSSTCWSGDSDIEETSSSETSACTSPTSTSLCWLEPPPGLPVPAHLPRFRPPPGLTLGGSAIC